MHEEAADCKLQRRAWCLAEPLLLHACITGWSSLIRPPDFFGLLLTHDLLRRLRPLVLRCLLLVQITVEELNVISRLPHYCPVCAYHNWNLDGLVEMTWEYLDLLRIYTKPKVLPGLHQQPRAAGSLWWHMSPLPAVFSAPLLLLLITVALLQPA